MIPDQKKEEVKQVADIVEVVSDHVKLKRSGSGFTGLCPFHNEKTPSFHVTPTMGIYKCFGCGKGGDVINFVMEIDGVGFEEAVRNLAERYHVVLPEEQEVSYDPNLHLREGVFHALEFAAHFFHIQFKESPDAENARNYVEGRKLTKKTVDTYRIGFAPPSWNSFARNAKDAGINLDYLIEAGLVKEKENGTDVFDYFRDRLMFPIFNISSKVIGFGGRILDDSIKTAKYINSPQTLVYNKSEVLYGIHVAKNEIRKKEEILLVEGYTDVLSLHQAGIKNVVSSSGTALTPEQLRILHRYSDQLTMIYDADSAGQKAMIRGLDEALKEGLSVKMLTLPDKEDPDTFIRTYGWEAFEDIKREETVDFLQFLVSYAKGIVNWDDPWDRAKAIKRILYSIALVQDGLNRQALIQALSKLVRIGDRELFNQMGSILKEQKRQAERQVFRQRKREEIVPEEADRSEAHQRNTEGLPAKRTQSSVLKFPKFEKELIRLMLLHGDEMVAYISIHAMIEDFTDPTMKTFAADIYERFAEHKPITIEEYTRREGTFWPNWVGQVLIEEHSVSEHYIRNSGKDPQKNINPFKAAKGALKPLLLASLENKRQEVMEKLHESAPEEQDELKLLLYDYKKQWSRLFDEKDIDKAFPDPPWLKEQNKSLHTEEFDSYLQDLLFKLKK